MGGVPTGLRADPPGQDRLRGLLRALLGEGLAPPPLAPIERPNRPSVVGVALPSPLTLTPGALALRLAVIAALLGLGLAGLVQLRLEPPLARWPAAPGGLSNGSASAGVAPRSLAAPASADLLADLDRQDALLEDRPQAIKLLSRFVGAEITQFFWGGFRGSLAGLGLDPPETMDVRLTDLAVPLPGVQLELTPHQGGERYLARVVAAGSVPHGVACRGEGAPGAFGLGGGHLRCPPGWQALPFRQARP